MLPGTQKAFNDVKDYVLLLESQLRAADELAKAVKTIDDEKRVMDITGLSVHINAALFRDLLLAQDSYEKSRGR